MMRKVKHLRIYLLQSMQEHWTIVFAQDIIPNLNNTVGANSENIRVIGSMMQLAEGYSIRDHRVAARMPIRKDMCRFKKFDMA